METDLMFGSRFIEKVYATRLHGELHIRYTKDIVLTPNNNQIMKQKIGTITSEQKFYKRRISETKLIT
jgi:hypothetical protein